MDQSGTIIMLVVLAVALFWFGVELGCVPDVFGWHAQPAK
jgi:hypothetical protein